MPPRTGPRRKRRPKQAAPPPALRLAIIRTDETIDLVLAHRIELDDGNLVLRDGADAIIQIIASGEWREIRPSSPDDIPFPEEADNTPDSGATDERIDGMQREEATLTPPTREEVDQRFVPSSPEEAQRILMEMERRLLSPAEDPPNAPPPPPRKD